MTYAWYDVIGTLGTTIIIITYILLQLGRVQSEQLHYSILNAAGASLIIVSLCFNFNFPAFVVEFFWLLISLFGIGKYLMQKHDQ